MTEAANPASGLDDLSPEALLNLLADADGRERTAARDKLLIAHQWAVSHPATPESGVSTWGGEALLADESLGGAGCPQVAAYAAEPLAITLRVSPDTAKRLITDALELRHRLPETWKRVATLEIPAWKGRHVATLTHTLSLEAAGWVDQHIAHRLHRCGAKAVDTVVAHAIAKHDPARHAEREAPAKKQTWNVALHTPTASEYAGSSELHIVGDTLFLTDLYRRACRDAAAAKAAGDDSPLGVRKVQALAALFGTGGRAAFTGGRAASEASDQSRPHHPQAVLYLHLDKTDLDDDVVKVGKAERLGPVTTDKIHDWLGASTVRIQPVIRMDGDYAVNGHDPPDRIRDQVILRDPTCRFPGCQAHSRSCDLDHVVPYDPTGPPDQTRPSNLVPRSAAATTTPRPPDSGAIPARPEATASGRGPTDWSASARRKAGSGPRAGARRSARDPRGASRRSQRVGEREERLHVPPVPVSGQTNPRRSRSRGS